MIDADRTVDGALVLAPNEQRVIRRIRGTRQAAKL